MSHSQSATPRQHPPHDLESRVHALEQELAMLRRSTVDARSFRLVDERGNVRGEFSITPRGPSVVLLDEAGAPRLTLLVSPEGPGLTIADEAKGTRAWLGATNVGARLGLADGDGKQRAFLGVGNAGPTLDFYDGQQRSIWSATGRRCDPTAEG